MWVDTVTCRDGVGGGAAPMFFNMPYRDNIESLLHQHFGPPMTAGANTPPLGAAPPLLSTLTRSPAAFCTDPDMDDVIKAQFCAAAAAAAAGQNHGQSSRFIWWIARLCSDTILT